MKAEPIFARAATAAKLLDMSTAEFERLVAEGHLPPARVLGNEKRFDVDAMVKAIRGDAPMGGMKWR